MAVGDAHVFPGFLTPVLTQIYFQSHRLLFSHASAEARGQHTPERNFANQVSNSQPPDDGADTLTTEPPGRDELIVERPAITAKQTYRVCRIWAVVTST